MALLFMDSFDHYATADLLQKWAAVFQPDGANVAISAGNGRHGSASLRLPTNDANTRIAIQKSVGSSGSIAILGVAVRYSAAAGSSGASVAAIWDGGTILAALRVNPDGTLSVTRGDSGSGTVLGTTSAALPLNSFTYVEWKVTLSMTVGTHDVRLNGLSKLALTGQATTSGSTTWTTIELGHRAFVTPWSGALNVDYDDLYILDGSGAAPWNAFLGDCRVDARLPTAPGATTGWTPSAGANWAAVDDATPNGDTDYTSVAAAPATDTFVVQDAPVAGAPIFGVQHCLNLKKMDAGTCTVAPVVRHAGVDRVGADYAPGTSYGYGLLAQQTNPGTSAQWTEADFNAAEFGYKRTA
jgi:hypothetical protein